MPRNSACKDFMKLLQVTHVLREFENRQIFSPVIISKIMSLIVSHTRKCKRISWKKSYDFWTQKSVSAKKRKITLTQLCLNLLYKVMLKQIRARNIIRKLE